jgi:hypothetical protein
MDATAVVAKTEKAGPVPVIISLGRKSKKSIKAMGEGHGSLLEEVSATIKDLKSNGTIAASAQPIIVVVKQKEPKRNLLGF